jgi:protein subunit release factor A
LPVTEESNAGNDDISNFYVDEKEVKVEVMRARGAGGQVRFHDLIIRLKP